MMIQTMITHQPDIAGKIPPIRDRAHAAQLLVSVLEPLRNTDAIILAVPRGGVPVGYHVAQQLNLPMDLLPCRKITHPGDRDRSIGSVCLQEVVIHDSERDIPQEYVQHTINKLRNSLRRREKRYKSSTDALDPKGKTVIIVDDWLRTGDTILACLKHIRKQDPEQVVVATPVLTSEAHKAVRKEVDDLIFLVLDDTPRAYTHKYFPRVTEEEVLRLVERHRAWREEAPVKDGDTNRKT